MQLMPANRLEELLEAVRETALSQGEQGAIRRVAG
jgi:hypothetical protein